jgi:hypothetical protein
MDLINPRLPGNLGMIKVAFPIKLRDLLKITKTRGGKK